MEYHKDIKDFAAANYTDILASIRSIYKVSAETATEWTHEIILYISRKDVLGRYDPAKAQIQTYIWLWIRSYLYNKHKKGQLTCVPIEDIQVACDNNHDVVAPFIDYVGKQTKISQKKAKRLKYIIDMCDKGYNQAEIATKLGVSRQAVHNLMADIRSIYKAYARCDRGY